MRISTQGRLRRRKCSTALNTTAGTRCRQAILTILMSPMRLLHHAGPSVSTVTMSPPAVTTTTPAMTHTISARNTITELTTPTQLTDHDGTADVVSTSIITIHITTTATTTLTTQKHTTTNTSTNIADITVTMTGLSKLIMVSTTRRERSKR